VKFLENISVLLIGVIFLFTSSGYVLYKSSCSCTGEEHSSVFVRPTTCEEEFHKHHKHNENNEEESCTEEECHECSEHTKSCGCDNPQIFFIKLADKAIDDEAKFIVTEPAILNISFTDILKEMALTLSDAEDEPFAEKPPLRITSSLDFLIHIQQLKIPSLSLVYFHYS